MKLSQNTAFCDYCCTQMKEKERYIFNSKYGIEATKWICPKCKRTKSAIAKRGVI